MKKYILELTSKQQKELGFRYDSNLDEYVYEFPVYLYKRRPVVVCKLGIKEDNDEVWYQVCNTESHTYAAYYVKNYGENNIVPIIDKNIERQLKKLGAKRLKTGIGGRIHGENK